MFDWTDELSFNTYNYESDRRYPREVIRICKSKEDRQHNGQKKRYKGTNNDLQNIQLKLKIE